jgi:polar amino acid transport system ATP-binding protein/sulfate transport system ATP-binding protein
VSYGYDGKPVLRDINLEIKDLVRPGYQQGQIIGLLGPSGMGKTTLFRLLAGLEQPQQGQILAGRELKPVRRGTIGVVAQHYPLFAHRTVLGNLLVAGAQAGLRGQEARAKADDLLKRFGLEEQGSKYPAQLSGGQRQRVAIAQQFMCSDNFLLMDEPFSGLDVLAQEAVIRFIHEMASHDEDMTFILVTHDITAALQIADRVLVLGRDRDAAGTPIPGARIKGDFNLVERKLAWRPNIASLPEFLTLRPEIRDLFPTL